MNERVEFVKFRRSINGSCLRGNKSTGHMAFCTMILADMGAKVIKVETSKETSGLYLGASVSPLGDLEDAYLRGEPFYIFRSAWLKVHLGVSTN